MLVYFKRLTTLIASELRIDFFNLREPKDRSSGVFLRKTRLNLFCLLLVFQLSVLSYLSSFFYFLVPIESVFYSQFCLLCLSQYIGHINKYKQILSSLRILIWYFDMLQTTIININRQYYVHYIYILEL